MGKVYSSRMARHKTGEGWVPGWYSMPMRTRILVGGVVLVLLAGCVWYLWFEVPKNAPWQQSGTLVVATRGIPGTTHIDGRALGLSIEDVSLIRDTNDEVRVTLLAHHALFDDSNDRPGIMFDTELAAGSYTGIVLTLANPEERNAWQGDTPPAPLTLGGTRVVLDVPFRIEPDTTTALILGFETNPAVYAKDALRIYLPVIHAETRVGASVEERNDGGVDIRGGDTTANMMFGMDWDGSMYFNYRARADGTLKYAPLIKEPVSAPEKTETAPAP